MIIDERKVNLAEKDIEQWLWENPTLIRFGHNEVVAKWLYRQMSIPSGVADLVGITESNDLVVAEVKNTEIKPDALLQVARYAFDVRIIAIRSVENQGLWNYPTPYVYKLVIGRSIDFKTARDAEATSTFIFTFGVQMSLFLSEDLKWRRQFVDRREYQYETLASDDDMTKAVEAHAERCRTTGSTLDGERPFLRPYYEESDFTPGDTEATQLDEEGQGHSHSATQPPTLSHKRITLNGVLIRPDHLTGDTEATQEPLVPGLTLANDNPPS